MTTNPLTAWSVLRQAWQIYRAHFLVIVATVVVVWTPLELLSSYMDAFVFGEDDLRKSFRFAQFLDLFFGIIATAGVIFIGCEATTRQRATLGKALSVGLSSWGRMWWTRFLSGLVVIIGLLLLLVPGIYLIVRLAFVLPIAVQERISGSAAMARSFELTAGRFWWTFRLGLVLALLLALPILLLLLPTIFIPALDHWLVDAAAQLGCDVVIAFGTIALVTAYSNLRNEALAAVPERGSDVPPVARTESSEP